MKNKGKCHLIILSMMMLIAFSLGFAGCVSVQTEGQLSPNASQSVLNIRRTSSGIEEKKAMDIFVDGRQQPKQINNGGQGQLLVMNGLRNVYVKVGNYQSQMLTINAESEVIEFFVNFEEVKQGRNTVRNLNLTKISGGDINNARNNTNSPAPIINVSPNINVTGGATTVNTGDDNSIR